MIPMVDLKTQYHALKAEIDQAVKQSQAETKTRASALKLSQTERALTRRNVSRARSHPSRLGGR